MGHTDCSWGHQRPLATTPRSVGRFAARAGPVRGLDKGDAQVRLWRNIMVAASTSTRPRLIATTRPADGDPVSDRTIPAAPHRRRARPPPVPPLQPAAIGHSPPDAATLTRLQPYPLARPHAPLHPCPRLQGGGDGHVHGRAPGGRAHPRSSHLTPHLFTTCTGRSIFLHAVGGQAWAEAGHHLFQLCPYHHGASI